MIERKLNEGTDIIRGILFKANAHSRCTFQIFYYSLGGFNMLLGRVGLVLGKKIGDSGYVRACALCQPLETAKELSHFKNL